MKSTNDGLDQFECVICGCRTIEELGSYEICLVCGWEEDVDMLPDTSQPCGANGDYSVDEAKKNFEKYGTKYRPDDSRFPTNSEFLLLSWKLRKAYFEVQNNGTDDAIRELERLKAERKTTPSTGGSPLWAPTGEPVFECPCCHYPTLSERGKYEICEVCGWEDEYLSYPPPDKVIGGANGDYSMSEARENFKRYGYKYRPSDERFKHDPDEQQLQWNFQKVYAEIKRSGANEELYRRLFELRDKWHEIFDRKYAVKKS